MTVPAAAPAPLVVGHRGAPAHAPENTLAAFRRALADGAELLECDVHLSADGHVVVMHDETIDRTSNGVGNLADYTLSQLKEFDFSAGHPEFTNVAIPTLAEVFDVLGPTGLMINIELKNSVEDYPGLEEAVLAMVAEFEADLIRARTREGMKVAKAKGRLRGKSPKLTPRQEAHLVQLHAADEHTVGELAELFSVGRSTVYRALQRAERGRENALQ